MSHSESVAHAEEFFAPASAVWELLADWGGIIDWMPEGNIRRLVLDGEGIGAVRHLYTGLGVTISERLDAADRDAGTIDLSIIDPLPWGLLSYRARGTVEGISEQRCRLTWRGTFELPDGGARARELADLFRKLYSTMFAGIRSAVEGAA